MKANARIVGCPVGSTPGRRRRTVVQDDCLDKTKGAAMRAGRRRAAVSAAVAAGNPIAPTELTMTVMVTPTVMMRPVRRIQHVQVETQVKTAPTSKMTTRTVTSTVMTLTVLLILPAVEPVA